MHFWVESKITMIRSGWFIFTFSESLRSELQNATNQTSISFLVKSCYFKKCVKMLKNKYSIKYHINLYLFHFQPQIVILRHFCDLFYHFDQNVWKVKNCLFFLIKLKFPNFWTKKERCGLLHFEAQISNFLKMQREMVQSESEWILNQSQMYFYTFSMAVPLCNFVGKMFFSYIFPQIRLYISIYIDIYRYRFIYI